MARRRTSRGSAEIWPGFVDAFSSLLLVLIFVLAVFVLAQFFLTQALSGRDEALLKLQHQVDELAGLLALEKRGNEDLALSVSQLSASLQTTSAERDELVLRVRRLNQRASQAERSLGTARETVQADKETIKAQLAELESLKRDIASLREVRAQLERVVNNLTVTIDTQDARIEETEATLAERNQALERRLAELESLRAELERRAAEILTGRQRIAAQRETLAARDQALNDQREKLASRADLIDILRAALAESKDEAAKREVRLGALRDRTEELQARLADERERTRLAQTEIAKRKIRLAELQTLYLETQDRLSETEKQHQAARQATAAAVSQVGLLNQQIAELRKQLGRLEAALQASEAKDEKSQTVIADLGRRLNLALASKVEELSRYRSEFFGRLREVLAGQQGIRVVGDRFVFQSEVLFHSGSAEIEPEGRVQLIALAQTLLDIAEHIPPEIDWVLRVDGHTDRRPISTAEFPSNWELSAARAISVVKLLSAAGVPPRRLVAAGFGEFHPLDDSDDEIALRRNRRIELKLTQR